MLLESDLEFCSKTAPMLLEGSSNSARMLCEAETATEQNLQNRDTSKQEPVEAMRKISVQDQGTLRVRVFLYFVIPPPLPSSTHSIKTRLLRAVWRCSGWLLQFP
jgi:hypothetical protein